MDFISCYQLGCTDTSACNYDSEAAINDGFTRVTVDREVVEGTREAEVIVENVVKKDIQPSDDDDGGDDGGDDEMEAA